MCDTIAAVSAATLRGGVLFGKNSDRDLDEPQYLQFVPARQHPAGMRVRLTHTEIAQARETHAVLLSKPYWIWGAEIGANAYGLVIGNEALFSKVPASMAPGIIGMDYLRLALERARDTDEAIHVLTELLREHGQSGNCSPRREVAYHNSYLVADPRGAKVIETVEREWVVTSVSDYYAISNAMTIDDAYEKSSATLEAQARAANLVKEGSRIAFKSVFEDASQSISGTYRHGRATSLLSDLDGRLQVPDFLQILRDHKEGPPLVGRAPPRVCAHNREIPLGQTTGSWVASLADHQHVHWVTGTAAPCSGVFKPVLLELGLPDHGPKPGSLPDNSSLWWRHEQLRQRLDEQDQRVLESYQAERDVLESRFLQAMSDCPGLTDDSSRNEARQIVESCWREAISFENRWRDRLRANGDSP